MQLALFTKFIALAPQVLLSVLILNGCSDPASPNKNSNLDTAHQATNRNSTIIDKHSAQLPPESNYQSLFITDRIEKPNSVIQATAVPIAYGEDNIADFKQFIGNRPITNINDYKGKYSRRDVVEAAVFVQALRAGGFEKPIELVPVGTYRRILKELINGQIAATVQSNWGEDVLKQSALLNSDALVREGEFVVGFYTHMDNINALSARNLRDLQELSAVSNRQWQSDWRELNRLGLKSLIHVTEWENMVKMVTSRRVDFVLAPFQPPEDFHLEFQDIRLEVIPNLKFQLPGTRHWSFSKKHPEGRNMFEAISKGIKILRQKGQIRQAYLESGFFDPRVEDWKVISAD